MPARSYLFVPGDRDDMLAKAAARGADALILDMEDAVAPPAKDKARATIAAHLDGFDPDGPEIWIRVNNRPETLKADMAVAKHPIVTGVFVPKVNSPGDIHRAVAALHAAGGNDVQLDAMIETGRALLHAESIASSIHVRHLTLGLADLGADLTVRADPDDEVWAPVRMQLVVVSAGVGIGPPIAPVSPNFTDLDRFRAATEAWAAAGYGGRQVIHPAQVPVVNQAFTPSPQEVEAARRVLDMFEAALAEGRGAIRDEEGNMIDEAFVRRARRILALGDRSQ